MFIYNILQLWCFSTFQDICCLIQISFCLILLVSKTSVENIFSYIFPAWNILRWWRSCWLRMNWLRRMMDWEMKTNENQLLVDPDNVIVSEPEKVLHRTCLHVFILSKPNSTSTKVGSDKVIGRQPYFDPTRWKMKEKIGVKFEN